MLAGSPVRLEDLDDDAYVLVAATLPRGQTCADAVTPGGLRAPGLPDTYPKDGSGGDVPHAPCQAAGAAARAAGLRGVWSRSALTSDGWGRELAWFPATARSRARPVWNRPLALGAWRDAARWSALLPPRQVPTSCSGRTRFPLWLSVSTWYSQLPQMAQSGLPV